MEDRKRWTHLYQETKECLEKNGKSENDVKWVGTTYEKTSWENFKKIANFKYNSADTIREISKDLYVMGDDWWLERLHYDGSEYWIYKERCINKKYPKEPSLENLTMRDLLDDFFWEHLFEDKDPVQEGVVYVRWFGGK